MRFIVDEDDDLLDPLPRGDSDDGRSSDHRPEFLSSYDQYPGYDEGGSSSQIETLVLVSPGLE